MAKQYIVKATIHGIAKKGDKKVVIKASPEPQNVPGALVKELLAGGVIEEYVGKGKAPSNVDDDTDDNADGPDSGDGVTGD